MASEMCRSHFSTAELLIRGPCVVSASCPFPVTNRDTRATSFSLNCLYTVSCTRKRLAHTQVCPLLRNLDIIAPSTARSKFASSKTMKGAFPPSSMEVLFTVPAHCCRRSLPVAVDPVKLSLATEGWEASTAPTSEALPVTTLKTPGGMPALLASSPRASAERGVNSEGFTTREHPAARAAPALRVIMAQGKFHGVMAAQTPTGCFNTMQRMDAEFMGMVSP
mmetsp:Transcript_9611/g.13055  ORF Transcript_9611/g.13055 Transcript_9611/m.13055 type:complete len:222 (-) Transcript_9611:33-698(-)